MSVVQSLKSIPVVAAGNFRKHGSTMEKAKKDRLLLAPFVYIMIFFASACTLMGCCLAGAQKALDSSEGLKAIKVDVHFYSMQRAVLLGMLFALVLFVNYLLTRLLSIKIFVRKTKKVLHESFIEFSLHSLTVSLVFLITAFLCLQNALLIIGAMLIGAMYFFIVLIQGIMSALPPEKIRPRLFLTVSLFAVIGYVFVSLAASAIFLLMSYDIMVGIVNGIHRLLAKLEERLVIVADRITKQIDTKFDGKTI